MSSTQSSLPVKDTADGTVGSAVPTIATQVAGSDGTNLRTLHTDASGNLLTSSRVVLTPSAPTVFSVGVASATAVAANANRKGLVLTNVSNARISLAFGTTAVLNNGVTLYPGGVYVMDDFLFTVGTVTAIASVASSSLAIQEYT